MSPLGKLGSYSSLSLGARVLCVCESFGTRRKQLGSREYSDLSYWQHSHRPAFLYVTFSDFPFPFHQQHNHYCRLVTHQLLGTLHFLGALHWLIYFCGRKMTLAVHAPLCPNKQTNDWYILPITVCYQWCHRPTIRCIMYSIYLIDYGVFVTRLWKGTDSFWMTSSVKTRKNVLEP